MRDLDLIVFGATGYTGRLVAEALLEFPEDGLRWAIAGRSQDKLEAIKTGLTERFPEANALELVVADVGDPQSMRAMARRTRVVCTTVGPYGRLGDAVVEACVAEGTDCCDLTGEVNWMRKNIDAHHERAAASKVRIVHAAGFDSIPFDIGVYALQKAAIERFGEPSKTVRTATTRLRGGFSGGTVASMVLLFDSIKRDRSILRLMGNPYALDPGFRGPDKNDSREVRFWKTHQVWTTPFIMAGCNTRVVRRSHALLGRPWGADFSYAEAMGAGRGLSGWLRGQVLRLGLGVLVAVLAIPLTRRLAVGSLLPRPGDGPTRAQREAGHFGARVVGVQGEQQLILDVIGEGDPGYLATSRMLAQTAVALACDDLPETYGVLTPGGVMGDALLRRLPRVGIRFEIRD